jgi:hypothetical protein
MATYYAEGKENDMQTEQTTNVEQLSVLGQQDAVRQRTTDVGRQKLKLSFSMREAARLSGMSYWTLRFWCRKGWAPEKINAWVLVGLTILNAAGRGRGTGSYLGDICVRRTMESMKDLDDALLLGETLQDAYVAEATAAIANQALPNEELQLTDELVARLARVLQAIDRQARKMKYTRRGLGNF